MDDSGLKVLLIEDNPGDARLIKELLGETARGAFELEFANRLSTGLERLAHGGIEVVLLDLSLPECRGLNTFRRVHDRLPAVPIVVLTGHNDETLAVTAVQEGAEDYLVKGQVDSRSLVRSLHYAIERTKRRQAEAQVSATKQELRLARQIQQKLFPTAPPQFPGYDIGGVSHAAEATGGDYFDYIPMLDDSLGVVIGDVSGHGLGPALLMAETRAYLRAMAQTHTDVGEILKRANVFLAKDTEGGNFVTLFFGRLEARTRLFNYASAGHLSGYLMNASGDVKKPLPSSAMPLGITEDGHFDSVEPIPLETGDLIVLFTDGVVEEFGPDDTPFGVNRVLDVVRSHASKPARTIVETLYQAVRDYCKDQTPLDDITAVVIKVEGE